MAHEARIRPCDACSSDAMLSQRFKTHFDTCMPVVEHYKGKGKVHPVCSALHEACAGAHGLSLTVAPRSVLHSARRRSLARWRLSSRSLRSSEGHGSEPELQRPCLLRMNSVYFETYNKCEAEGV